ncbi:MAG: hypothetical protein AAF530_17755 [Pseudomonadota bacterium]
MESSPASGSGEERLDHGFFRSASFREASADLIFARLSDRPGATLIVGPSGSGKTWLLHSLLLDPSTGDKPLMITVSPKFSVEDFIDCCQKSFGGFDIERKGDVWATPGAEADDGGTPLVHASREESPTIADLTNFMVRRGLANGPVTLLIDSAASLRPEVNRVLLDLAAREKHGRRLVHVVFAVNSEERDFLSEVKDHTAFRCDLLPLSESEVEDYIMFCLKAAGYDGPVPFSKSAVAAIAEETEGLASRVNELCQKVLLIWAASPEADRGLVTLRHVVQAVLDEAPVSEKSDTVLKNLRFGAGGASAVEALINDDLADPPTKEPAKEESPAKELQTKKTSAKKPPSMEPSSASGPQEKPLPATAGPLPVALGGSWDWELPPELLDECRPGQIAPKEQKLGDRLTETDLFMDPPERPTASLGTTVSESAAGQGVQAQIRSAQKYTQPTERVPDHKPAHGNWSPRGSSRKSIGRRFAAPLGVAAAVVLVLVAGGWLASPHMAGGELDAKLEAFSLSLRTLVDRSLGGGVLIANKDADRTLGPEVAEGSSDLAGETQSAQIEPSEETESAMVQTTSPTNGGDQSEGIPLSPSVPETAEKGSQSLPETITPAEALEAPVNASQLLDQGDLFLALKNLGAARTAYQEAVSFGSARAQTAMGKTYDPLELEARGLDRNLSNADLARSWYRRGLEAGDNTASQLLETLDAIEPPKKLDP